MDKEQRKQAIVYANRLQYVLPDLVPGAAEIDAVLKPDDSINVVVIWSSVETPPAGDVIRSTFKISAEAVASCLLPSFANHDERFERRLCEVIVDRVTAHSSSVAREQRGELVIWHVGVEDLKVV